MNMSDMRRPLLHHTQVQSFSMRNTAEKREGPWWEQFNACLRFKEEQGRWPEKGDEDFPFFHRIRRAVHEGRVYGAEYTPDRVLAIKHELPPYRNCDRIARPRVKTGSLLDRVLVTLESGGKPEIRDVNSLRNGFREGRFAGGTIEYLLSLGLDIR